MVFLLPLNRTSLYRSWLICSGLLHQFRFWLKEQWSIFDPSLFPLGGLLTVSSCKHNNGNIVYCNKFSMSSRCKGLYISSACSTEPRKSVILLHDESYHQTLFRHAFKKRGHQSEDAVTLQNIFDNISLQLGRSIIYFLWDFLLKPRSHNYESSHSDGRAEFN